VESLKYDIVISETPTTPTMLNASLATILETLKIMPDLGPLFIDKIIQLMPGLPDKAEILNRLRARMGTGQSVPGSPTMPGVPGGAPPGPIVPPGGPAAT
jgi:hypothetical protein